MMKPTFKIDNPCNEDWEKMKIGVDSRFCNHCSKDVIDFRNKSRQEILGYLLANYNKKVCGRFYSDQLDFSLSDFVVTINALSQKQQNNNLAFYLLTLGALVLSGCEEVDDIKEKPSKVINMLTRSNIRGEESKKDSVQIDTLKNQEIKVPKVRLKVNPVLSIRNEYNSVYSMHSSELLGFVIRQDPMRDITKFKYVPSIIPYTCSEIMPEYKGGINSLMSFVKANLKYPEWEKKRKIEGIVYTTFVVDRTGKIKDAKIVKSVEGSRNFDQEVLRVIKAMPDWKPGQQDSENVDVIFNLPFNFEL